MPQQIKGISGALGGSACSYFYENVCVWMVMQHMPAGFRSCLLLKGGGHFYGYPRHLPYFLPWDGRRPTVAYRLQKGFDTGLLAFKSSHEMMPLPGRHASGYAPA